MADLWQILFFALLAVVVVSVSVGLGLVLPKLSAVKRIFRRELVCKADCQSEDLNISPLFTDPAVFHKEIAQLCYYHDQVAQNQTAGLGGSVLAALPLSGNAASAPPLVVVFQRGSIRYVILRGSKTKQEDALDLKVRQSHLPGVGAVHRGFAEAFTGIKTDLLSSLVGDYSKLVIFGHSLGAALANVLACYLMKNLPGVWAKCLAFACAPPRVFSLDVDLPTNTQLYQIINDADVVPTLPLSVTDLGKDSVYYYKGITANQIRLNSVQKTLVKCHITRTYAEALAAM